MKKVADVAAYIFIASVLVLSIVAIFGIWDMVSDDVIGKSFQSIGLLAVVTIIVLIADGFLDKKEDLIVTNNGSISVVRNKETFKVLRNMTLAVLITSVAVLALIGVLAIWDVIQGDNIGKSLGSIGVIAFSSLIIVLISLNREGHPALVGGKGNRISGGLAVLLIILGIMLISVFQSLIF